MCDEILYYVPQKGVKNRAGTANLTIDWFKKKFNFPIDWTYFEELPIIERSWVFEPQIGRIIYFHYGEYKIQGKVESILLERTDEREVMHVLIRPFNK